MVMVMRRTSKNSVSMTASAKSVAREGALNSRRMQTPGKRARISGATARGPYLPPEDWYQPQDGGHGDYRVVQKSAGEGFRHVLSESDIRERLALLPAEMVEQLEVVQLSCMTRKKRQAPCYGMQWGNTIYLYPIESNRVERFTQAPRPAQQIEAQMYGARWQDLGNGDWHLIWTEEAIRDFYLNNVLIHELGHVIDNRNSNAIDRERWAEWFALEFGYKPSRAKQLATAGAKRYFRKRHHR